MFKLSQKIFFSVLLSSFCSSYVLGAEPSCVVLDPPKNTNLPVTQILDYLNTMAYPGANVPGLIMSIVSGTESIIISCGETEVGNHTRPTAKTMWAIGSVSKVVTGTIFSQMVAQRKVSLIDPVSLHLPVGSVVPSANHRNVTLLDLATHSAGFERSAFDDAGSLEDYQHSPTYDQKTAFDWMAKTKLVQKPGTLYLYSNFGFGLLGQALAYADRTDYATLVTRYITKNLGMVDTTVHMTEEQQKREAKSYWMNNDLIVKDWPFDFEAPSGGIYSTAADMAKFIQYHLDMNTPANITTNQINHATYLYQGNVTNPLAFKDDGLALGWHVDYPSQQLPLILHKNGWVSGFTSWVILMPTANVGIFSVSNKPSLNIESDLKKILAMIMAKKSKAS